MDDVVEDAQDLLKVPKFEEQLATTDGIFDGEKLGKFWEVEQRLSFSERVHELGVQGRVAEEAVEVLHDEAEGVLGNHGILDVGQFLFVQLLERFREVFIVRYEPEHRQLVDVAIHDEVDKRGEGLLFAAFLVEHDRLKERMCLVERQEPMADTTHILAAVE